MKAVTYHYVRPDTLGLPHFRYLHIDDFRQQLDRFVANDDLVEREVFFRALESGAAPPRGCVLTFDDGFKDHFEFSNGCDSHQQHLLGQNQCFRFLWVTIDQSYG